jgi:predicted nucleic acid-binding protein
MRWPRREARRAVRLIEACRAMGCPDVLSEDLNDGQDYAGVRVTNPFR